MEIEANVEKPICTWAEEDGWEVRKLKYVAKNGAPDRMFYRAGRVVFIEFKRPGKTAKDHRSTLQKREGERMLKAGIEYYMINSLAEGIRVLGLRPRAAATHSAPFKR